MSHIERATTRLAALLLGAVVLLGVGVNRAYAQSHPEQTPFLQMLSYLHVNNGYTVAQGTAGSFGGCSAYISAFGSCFGNNPATPYFVLNVPIGGITLPTYLTGSGPGPGFAGTGPAPGYAPINTFWRLHANEALITIITMPPQGAYFSQQSYMVERDAHFYDPNNVPGSPPCTPGTPFQTGTSPNLENHAETPDCNYNVFGFFNNALNNALIRNQAAFSFSNYTGCTGNCAIAIVTTPNQQVFTDATNAFTALGYNTKLLFLEGMATGSGTPSPLLEVDPPQYNADTMATILRYTIPQGTAGGTWETNIATNVLVFRVTMPIGGTITPIATPTITAQSCNTNESGYVPPSGPALCAAGASVQMHLTTLRNLLLNWFRTNVSASYASGTASAPPPTLGFNCLTAGTACAGPTPDNNAYRGFSPGPLASGLPIIGIGVLHSASPSDTTTATPANNAVYTGLSIADNVLNTGGTGENQGVADQTQTNLLATGFTNGNLAGSAAEILNDLSITSTDAGFVNDLPNLYVVVFNQMGGTCVLPGSMGGGCTKPYVVNVNPTLLPATDPSRVTERGYLYPPASLSAPTSTAMQVGADPNYMTSPYILYVPR